MNSEIFESIWPLISLFQVLVLYFTVWNDIWYKDQIFFWNYGFPSLFKGAEATSVAKITQMKKWFKLKDMLDFNALWKF